MECPNCGRSFPGVLGARTQACPRCGHEFAAREAPDAAARADPAGAFSFGLRFFARNYGSLLALWTPVIATDILAAFSLGQYMAETGIPADPTRMAPGDQLRYLGVATPLLLLVFAVQLGVWSLVAARVVDEVEGSGSKHLRRVAARPFALLGMGALLTVAYLAGLLLLIVPFLVFFHWFLFAPAAMVTEEGGVGRAFDASRRFAKTRRTFGFTALVLFVGAGVYVASALLGLVLLAALAALGLDGTPVADVVGPVSTWFLAPLVPVLPASYWALARRAPAPAEQAMEPVRPDAPAAERFRTTKCPGCGTLIPYTATGAPVDVSCPVCGRSGRVL